VNQNPSSQSGDAVQNTPQQNSAGSGNPYSAQFEDRRSNSSDLDAHAPELKSNEMMRMNRRAIGLLLALVVLMGVAAIFVVSNLLHSNKKEKPREEVVKVPPPPARPPLPLIPPPQQVRPIPMAATPPRLPPPLPQKALPAPPHVPTLMERRMADKAGPVGVASEDGSDSPSTAPPPLPFQPPSARGAPAGQADADANDPNAPVRNSAYRVKPLSPVSKAQALVHPNVLMVRGTYIRCVLETHIVTDIPGFTSCVVTEPVYSVNGKRLLLPKGSKALGKYDTEPNGDRVAVIWDRIITPNGIDVIMASPGVDTLGGAGHQGYLDSHWSERISSALLVSLFSDAFKYAAAQSGPSSANIAANGTVVQSPFQSNTAQTLQDLAQQAVRRSANRPATVTINQGTIVTVYVAKDVDFSAVVAN